MLEPFRTPFWLEEKKWYVTALGIPQDGSIDCFTLPDSENEMHLCPYFDKISISTAPLTNAHLFNTDTIRHITVNLTDIDTNAADQVGIGTCILIERSKGECFSLLERTVP
jgi:hypothetical protein